MHLSAVLINVCGDFCWSERSSGKAIALPLGIGVGIRKMFKYLHLSYLGDGQGADRLAILSGDRSCCLTAATVFLENHTSYIA